MSEKLKNMIGKLKAQQEAKKLKENKEPSEPSDDELDVPPEKPKCMQEEEAKQKQRITISNRIQELQNNGIYRIELLYNMEQLTKTLSNINTNELTEAVNNLAYIIGLSIKESD